MRAKAIDLSLSASQSRSVIEEKPKRFSMTNSSYHSNGSDKTADGIDTVSAKMSVSAYGLSDTDLSARKTQG